MAGNHVLLETIELTSSASSITFDNLPSSGYTDLKIVASLRGSTAANAVDGNITFNGSSSSFTWRELFGTGSSALSGSNTTNNALGQISGANLTSNTFTSMDIYIPNYTSSNYKSFSVDFGTENNATLGYAGLIAGLWSNTAAITSISIAPGSDNWVPYSTFSLYGVAATGTTPAVAPKATGGNMVSTDGTYWYHTFLTSGTFTPQTALTCDYLVIAGGGSGGTRNGSSGAGGAGGGAGGYRTSVGTSGRGASAEATLSFTGSTNYAVTVGAGGAGRTGPADTYSAGNNGNDSSIIGSGISKTSLGGGAGGINSANPAGNGGSGGGSGYSGTPGTGATGQGYDGGSGANVDPGPYPGGGGGGAGGAGSNGSGSTGGAGGIGVTSSINGVSTTYATGGDGAIWTTTGTVNATANTGNGGRGSAVNASGNGGSGIVIIRYAMV